MKWWLYLSTIWIPIGRLYMTIWNLWAAGVTWRQLITERAYRIMIIESGIFGVSTPLLNWKRHKRIKEMKRKKQK